MKSSFTIFAFNQVQISTCNDKYLQNAITGTRVHSVSLFSLKLSIFRASILTFSTQNHLILTYFTHLDTTHFFYKYYNIQHAHRFFHLGVHVPFYLHCWGYIQIFGGAISNSSFGGTKKINCIFSMQGRAPCCFL